MGRSPLVVWLWTFTIILWISYVCLAIGIETRYIHHADAAMRIFVSVVLVYLFNPLRNRTVITSTEQKIAFIAGLTILLSTSVFQYLHPKAMIESARRWRLSSIEAIV